MEALLEEKLEAEAQATRAKQLLDVARDAASKAEARVGTLEAELDEARSERAAGALAQEDAAAAERGPTGASQVMHSSRFAVYGAIHPPPQKREFVRKGVTIFGQG